MTSNTKILLKTKCEGLPEESDFEKIEEEIIEPKEGQIGCNRFIYH